MPLVCSVGIRAVPHSRAPPQQPPTAWHQPRLMLATLLLALLPAAVHASPCEDVDSSCSMWAKGGECSGNPEFMRFRCARSCGLCTQACSPSSFEALFERLQSWTPDRLTSLRAALDPDGDGSIDDADWRALVGGTSTCQPSPQPQACPDLPSHAQASSLSGGGGALSTRVAETSTPTFVLGKAPPKTEPSLYYFRPEVGVGAAPLDAQSQDVFERCATQCLQSDDCWLFSISSAHRSCSVHTKLWGFTSLSV